jgi:hypothetical protein
VTRLTTVVSSRNLRYPRCVPRSPSRPPGPDSRGSFPAVPRRAVAPTSAGSRSSLKLLVAGVDKDERASLESRVRQALGSHASEGPWSVSLVKLGSKWSVTLNGPGERFRSLSFASDDARLQDAIRDAVGGDRVPEVQAKAGAAGAPSSPSTARASATPMPSTTKAGEVRVSHVCPQCKMAVMVVYEAQAGEAKVSAPLACPHCWHVSHVEVGAWAAAGGDYRAEKA